MMEAPATAIEQYFNQLIHMRLLTQVVVSDRHGNSIVACTGDSQMPEDSEVATNEDVYNNDDDFIVSNVVISGARCFQNFEQLQLGSPEYISLQYHDNTVVQILDGECCMLTLIGARSQGHCVGGLLVLLPQIRATEAYQELLKKTEECFQ
ncbi:uncharacterized protein TM35_000212400 [Trypanosoma theileri]|uniref:Uncharacterized protein n=1 Tax=Trypanosoma theileri TaxID=67003 RepID=A0A1X0NSG3_9TRYP|nr:uncharacterized protein TM35_000212400 [Trypanosoma theileri]ORC87634.1 hypothetical protein TM35_000212400 [Trypanosoma theileri]